MNDSEIVFASALSSAASQPEAQSGRLQIGLETMLVMALFDVSDYRT